MKKTFFYLLTAGLAFSMIANTGVANAAVSNANVWFLTPDTSEPVAPLDPTNPQIEIVNPEDSGTVTGEVGPLTLDYVSNFIFNDVTLNSNSNEPSVSLASVASPSLQVSDRRQTGEGWNVVASLENFTDESGSDSLQNATITLNSGIEISPIAELEGEETTLISPQVEDPITLESNNAATQIVEAENRAAGAPLREGAGLGTWIMSWLATDTEATEISNENVILTVPARTATAGEHTSTISWVLTSGPF